MNSLYFVYAIWLVSEIALNRLMRSKSADDKTKDKKTEWLLWSIIIGFVCLGIYIRFNTESRITNNENIIYLGEFIIITGMLFRFIAIKQLGKFFTVDVTIKKDHQLMQTGLYKYIRHPSYTGALLSFIGFGFTLNSWLCLLVVFIPVFIVFNHRMAVEEKALLQAFEHKYQDYIIATKRLLPFVY